MHSKQIMLTQKEHNNYYKIIMERLPGLLCAIEKVINLYLWLNYTEI